MMPIINKDKESGRTLEKKNRPRESRTRRENCTNNILHFGPENNVQRLLKANLYLTKKYLRIFFYWYIFTRQPF